MITLCMYVFHDGQCICYGTTDTSMCVVVATMYDGLVMDGPMYVVYDRACDECLLCYVS